MAMEPELPLPEAVWVATALLHREHPDRDGFQVDEIQDRLHQEGLPEEALARVEVHATLQLVANMRPNPATYRYLYATPDGERRLYRPGDDHHPDREEGAPQPRAEDLPDPYAPLLEWYRTEYAPQGEPEAPPADREVSPPPAPTPDRAGTPDRVRYKVVRVQDASEAETLLDGFAQDGWRLADTVSVPDPELGATVWLVLQRPR